MFTETMLQLCKQAVAKVWDSLQFATADKNRRANKPCARELDRQRGRGQLAAESPLLWSEDELAHLNGSPMKAAGLEREEGIKIIMSLTQYGLCQDRYFSNTRMIYLRRPFHMRFSSKLLLPFGYVSDPSETESVISSQGPVCPMSPSMERVVLDQLSHYFIARLDGYPTTLSEDEALLTDSSLDLKKQVTTQLVKLEKKMLIACLHATAFVTLWRFESGHELGRWKVIEEYRLMHNNTTRLCMQSTPSVMAEMEKLCQNKRELSSFEVRCLFEKFAEMEKLCRNKRELSSFEMAIINLARCRKRGVHSMKASRQVVGSDC
ncbi:hypothetical protein C5167_029259 [Papaver somniferum]|nr:hypothetical protein C5167_029259 [Papaver somniferum]